MKKLYEPLQIGSMALRNRTFMAPMSLGYETQDGTINPRMQAYWQARAAGGVGCIIVDALSVDPNVPYLGNTLCFRSPESLAAYRAFTDSIHALGAKVIPQITHPGPESISAFFGVPPAAPSCYLNSMGQKTRALRLDELPGIVEQYAKGAADAKAAGFDGIELHCAHAYMLLGSFLSPLRNKRTDAYGGPIENRARLLFEVLDAIRAACGPDYPIVLRMSGSERAPGGNTLADMEYLVPQLEAHGVSALEVSGSTQYEQCNKIIPCHGEERGLNVPQAEALHRIARVPVLVVGKINEPGYAEYLVESGKVDGVVLGRALLADPEFVNKAQAGQAERIAPCAACGVGCVGEQTKRLPASCVINPCVGREAEFDFSPVAAPKQVVVVGGGIGGMAAARAYALRGHTVELLEAQQTLGGQMNLACVPPHKQELSRWIAYLNRELARLGVKIRCGAAASAQTVQALHPDVVVVATGAQEFVPPVPGVEPEKAITAQMVLSQQVVIPGGNVLVVGGGLVGLETAELLMHQSRGPMAVTVLEMTPEVGAGLIPNNKQPMLHRLQAAGVCMLTNAKLASLEGGSARVQTPQGEQNLTGFTHIVFACGSKPCNALAEELRAAGPAAPEVVVIGDANGVRQALEAVREGTEAAAKKPAAEPAEQNA